MLTDQEIDDLCSEWLYVAPGRTYEEHRPFARAIESAATAPLLARIAELDRSLDVMAQNTEAQAHASLQREIELTEKVEKLTRELEEARKDADAFTDEQLEAAVKAWFQEKIVPGKFPFHKRMRAAIDAAIKEQK